MIQEIWKPVQSFEGRYEVSSLGRFKALRRPLIYKDGRHGWLNEKLLKGSLGNNGYYTIVFDSKTKTIVSVQLVWRCIITEVNGQDFKEAKWH